MPQNKTLQLNQVMATSVEGSTCKGDSGGPLIYSPCKQAYQTPFKSSQSSIAASSFPYSLPHVSSLNSLLEWPALQSLQGKLLLPSLSL